MCYGIPCGYNSHSQSKLNLIIGTYKIAASNSTFSLTIQFPYINCLEAEDLNNKKANIVHKTTRHSNLALLATI